jgi:hypothetical protein
MRPRRLPALSERDESVLQRVESSEATYHGAACVHPECHAETVHRAIQAVELRRRMAPRPRKTTPLSENLQRLLEPPSPRWMRERWQ